MHMLAAEDVVHEGEDGMVQEQEQDLARVDQNDSAMPELCASDGCTSCI